MALANLSINIHSNVGDVTANMGKFGLVTAEEMRKSQAAIAGFDGSVTSAAKSVDESSGSISSSMKAATDSIITGAEAAAKAVETNLVHIGKDVAENVSDGLNMGEGKVKEYAGQIGEHLKGTAEHAAATAATFYFFGAEAAAALGLVFNAVLVLTVAVKALDFAFGLVNGESYKSENIDALIAANKEVQNLQGSLHLTAVEAGALNDAIQRLGVDKGDISAVQGGVASVLRGDKEELDRLGVAYKDVNGRILENREIVQNAKNKLDEYTDGWDRNQAAAAIGMGTYEQIGNYLKVNQEELKKSKDRLDEFNLGIGPESQAAIASYQGAMLEFKNEQRLMSEGFKRAIADNIMPALTDLAIFFKDGWPVVVNVFRYTMAEITSLMWGLKMSADIVIDIVKGGFLSITDILVALAKASALALTGDFGGAKDALVQGWEDAKGRIGAAGDEIVKDAQHNAAAMKLAWAFDDRQDPSAGKAGKGKAWSPKPEAEEDGEDGWLKSNAKYLEFVKASWDRYNAVTKAATQVEIETLKIAHEWGIVDTQTYLEKKHALTVAEIDSEIQSAAKVLKSRKDALKELPDSDDPAQQAARNEARKRLEEAEKNYQVLLFGRKRIIVDNENESKQATYSELRGYQEIKAVLQDLQGDTVAAYVTRQKLDDDSLETQQLIAAAMSGNAAAADAYWAKETAGVLKLYDLVQSKKKEIDDIRLSTPDIYGNVNSFGQRQSDTGFAVGKIDTQMGTLDKSKPNELITLKQLEDQKLAIITRSKAEQAVVQQRYDDMMLQSQLNAASAAIGVMSKAAGDNKAIQIAALAMQTAIALAQIEIAARVAEMRALAELGPIAGMAIIPEIEAMKYVNMAITVASGIVQAGQIAGARADGGPVQAGKTYLVGERGPELLTMGASDGYVTPNGGGGGTVEINQTFHITGVAADLQQNMRVIAKQAGDQAKAELINSMNRGEVAAVASGRRR